MISTHAPHARRGIRKKFQIFADGDFYSRASCEARLPVSASKAAIFSFLLTRLMRGAALHAECRSISVQKFLLTRLMRGAALAGGLLCGHSNHFYSRASCEARLAAVLIAYTFSTFLLTRLMRGAAMPLFASNISTPFLLTRLMRGAALTLIYDARLQQFLLTRLMRGAALWCHLGCICISPFLLTRLMRGAAGLPLYVLFVNGISTHAPHARRGRKI